MQRIERYGVLALVFLLVTIVTFALWDEGSPETSDEVAVAAPEERAADRTAPDEARQRQIALAEQRRREAEAVQRRLEQQRLRDGDRKRDLADRYHSAKELQEASKDTRGGAFEQTPEPKVDGTRGSTPTLRIRQRGEPSDARGAVASEERGAPSRPDPAVSSARAKDRILRSAEHEIAPGDTLGAIAARHLGSASRWREIAAANPGLDPNRLVVGDTLTIPAGGASARAGGDSAPATVSATTAPTSTSRAPEGDGRRYTIRSGDLLSVIAQERLGGVSELPRILALNPGLDPDRLVVGQVIRLPQDAASASSPAVASAPRRSSSAADDRPRVR